LRLWLNWKLPVAGKCRFVAQQNSKSNREQFRQVQTPTKTNLADSNNYENLLQERFLDEKGKLEKET
jgi:hypothetical protein